MATAVTPAQKKPSDRSNGKSAPNQHFDPDEYRMTIGEHLEELRTRMVLGLLGFTVACVVCFIFGDRVVWYFCRPLAEALERNQLPPTVYVTEASESFMVYIKISMITAAAFASPWMVYQIWQFIAAGLYPNERKYITKYLPMSITLLVLGMVFLYFVVLPLMLEFFIRFNIGPAISMTPPTVIDPAAAGRPPVLVPLLNGNPPNPVEGQIWMDVVQHRLKFMVAGQVRVVPFGSDKLVTPIITLSQYIDMVVNMLLSFGVAFQMPLAVLALVRIGIADVPTLKSWRRYVYFGMSIVAAVIVPDVVGGMIALMIPLILLFEMGLWMAREPGEKTGYKAWLTGSWATLRRQLRKPGAGNKLLTYAGFVLLLALVFHALSRSRQPLAPSQPGITPGTTRPATQSATQPATRAVTEPATGPSIAPRTVLSTTQPSASP